MTRDSESILPPARDVASCTVIKPMLPAAALEVADLDELASVAAHLARCPTCRHEYDDYRVTVDALALAAPDREPPADLRSRFFSRFNPPSPLRQPGAWRWFAAAAVLVLALLVSNVVTWVRLGEARGELAAIAQARQAARTAPLVWYDLIAQRSAPDEQEGNPRGTLCAQQTGQVAWLITEGLPVLPAGQVYQAWLSDGTVRHDVGTFRVDERGRGFLTIRLERPLTSFSQLGVTTEPDGGSPEPVGPQVLIGSL